MSRVSMLHCSTRELSLSRGVEGDEGAEALWSGGGSLQTHNSLSETQV